MDCQKGTMENMELTTPKLYELGKLQNDFWKGRRVFVTGHTGFKGSWLSLWLCQLGAKVTGFALAPPTTPNMFELADVAKDMVSLVGDIRDQHALAQAIKDARPEIIIHMAAQSLVRASYGDPVSTYATNVMGTVHVLDAVRSHPCVKGVLIITSDKCYDNREWVWGYRENEAMGGYDPYSNSKGCAELVTSAYRHSFFNPEFYDRHGIAIATARAGNVIGGGDWAQDRLVPDAMRAFLKGTPLKIRNPSAIRPWQHVLDPLHGYLQLCQQLLGENAAQVAQAWNFGPHQDSECSVDQLLTRLVTCWGNGAQWCHVGDSAGLHEATYLRLDCSKARLKLGWEARYNLEKTLAITVDWFRAYQSAAPSAATMRDITIQQINTFAHGHAS